MTQSLERRGTQTGSPQPSGLRPFGRHGRGLRPSPASGWPYHLVDKARIAFIPLHLNILRSRIRPICGMEIYGLSKISLKNAPNGFLSRKEEHFFLTTNKRFVNDSDACSFSDPRGLPPSSFPVPSLFSRKPGSAVFFLAPLAVDSVKQSFTKTDYFLVNLFK
jgi:hypothetical protein